MSINFLAAAAMAASAVFLSGCAWLPAADNSCNAIYQGTASGFKFEGIEIPLKTISPIKIAKIEYTPMQLAAVTETIRKLQEARLDLCKRSGDMVKSNATPTELSAMYRDYDRARAAEYRFLYAIKNGVDVRQVLDAGESAKNSVADLLPTVPATPTPTPPPNSKIIQDLSERVSIAEGNLKRVLQHFSDNQSGSVRIQIGSFGVGRSTLTAEMKNSISSQFGTVLEKNSGRKLPIVDVIGYADSSGNHQKNVDLGLRRASTVAEFLTYKFESKVQIRSISSGGIKLNDPDARRVDLTISDLIGATELLFG